MTTEYFYSEGYIYKGKETVCKLYGTQKQVDKLGKKIVKMLTMNIS